MLTAIIVAGGSSRRMGFDKTFALLGGQPVLARSIAAFEAADCVGDIIVVGREERLDEFRDTVAAGRFSKVRQIIAGGEQRQHSVAAGLRQLSSRTDFVAVHDAARPLIRPVQIERVLHAAEENGAACIAAPITDTLKRASAEGFVTGSVDREQLYAMQTPQIFARELLERAYAQVAAEGLAITDEVSAVERLGAPVVLVPNDDYNFKITFPADLALAEQVWAMRHSTAR
jgi:2-C-methyl-D-erythritol 4-phosphate cytidylyltransferase